MMLDKLIDLIVQFIELFKFWVVLDPYEAGVRLRLGKFVDVMECGLHWMIPFGVDRCLHENITPSTHSLGDESVTSLDNHSVGFCVVITYKVSNIQKALLEVDDVAHAVKDACAGEVGRVMRQLTWDAMQGQDCLDQLTTVCRKRGWRYGIEIISIQLSGLTLCKTLRLMNFH